MYETYCWWFRNPKHSNGINYQPQLVQDFWTISTSPMNPLAMCSSIHHKKWKFIPLCSGFSTHQPIQTTFFVVNSGGLESNPRFPERQCEFSWRVRSLGSWGKGQGCWRKLCKNKHTKFNMVHMKNQCLESRKLYLTWKALFSGSMLNFGCVRSGGFKHFDFHEVRQAKTRATQPGRNESTLTDISQMGWNHELEIHVETRSHFRNMF